MLALRHLVLRSPPVPLGVWQQSRCSSSGGGGPGPAGRLGLKRFSTAEAPVESRDPGTMRGKTLTMDTLNPQVKAVEYAVRGPIVIRAGDIERRLQQVSDTAGDKTAD
ncbi:alanine aminotransferase 2-like [Plectropomus leopardus]|uniref:alanine aminotransferase 2-like n=1 Tax=Plectropomus leopardus TaxID=160734 RepID=UPI001C4C0FD6|nr:alanine aminotransferase 2-like [Plectropomus leopardus]